MAYGPVSFSSLITFTRASSATYFDAAGVLQTAATNAPRFDYNSATLAAQGLLIEEARTNLLTYSEDFSNAAWDKAGVATITANALTSPAGTLAADLLNGINASDYVSQQPSYTSGTSYTHSCFVKAGAGSVVTLRGTALAFGTEILVDYNLSTGAVTVSGGSPSSFGIINTGNGWWRCWFAATASATASGQFQIRPSAGSLYIWGAQLEAGAFPTSYIPTTASSTTRAADVASVGTLSPWYNASEGTLYAEFSLTQPASGTNQFLARFSDNGYNNSIVDNVNAAGFATIATASGGVFDGIASTAVMVAANTITKVAGAYAANDLAACKDGGTVATDSTATIPSGMTRFDLGSDHAGLNRVKAGYLRRIAYYPRRLSNAELVSLTS